MVCALASKYSVQRITQVEQNVNAGSYQDASPWGSRAECVLPPLLSDRLAEGLVYHMDRRSNLGVCELHTACFTPGGRWFA